MALKDIHNRLGFELVDHINYFLKNKGFKVTSSYFSFNDDKEINSFKMEITQYIKEKGDTECLNGA